MKTASWLVFVTGFATFALEVAWLRSFTAAFRSTTDAFAIMLSAVLIALGLGVSLTPGLKRDGSSLGVLVGWAGIRILLTTPLIERSDLVVPGVSPYHVGMVLNWFCFALGAIAVEVKLTASPSYADCEGLEAFLKDHPETSAGVLVHTGRKVARMGTKIIALPWTMLAGL